MKTNHNTIREAIEYYYPAVAKRMMRAKSIGDAVKKGMITDAEGNEIALWLYINTNGEVRNIFIKRKEGY